MVDSRIMFVDNFYRKFWLYFLKLKDKVFVRFKELKTMVDKQTKKLV